QSGATATSSRRTQRRPTAAGLLSESRETVIPVLTMTKAERVTAALKGKEVDRVPFSFWGHHPPGDRTPEGQAAIHLELHQTYDLDFMKLMFHNMSLLTDFGCRFGDAWDPDLG